MSIAIAAVAMTKMPRMTTSVTRKSAARLIFDSVPAEVPAIDRIEDCQTCFLCELYCPTDALYVSPFKEERELVDEATLIARGLLPPSQLASWVAAKAP